jgi:hypothetical protein
MGEGEEEEEGKEKGERLKTGKKKSAKILVRVRLGESHLTSQLHEENHSLELCKNHNTLSEN